MANENGRTIQQKETLVISTRQRFERFTRDLERLLMKHQIAIWSECVDIIDRNSKTGRRYIDATITTHRLVGRRFVRLEHLSLSLSERLKAKAGLKL